MAAPGCWRHPVCAVHEVTGYASCFAEEPQCGLYEKVMFSQDNSAARTMFVQMFVVHMCGRHTPGCAATIHNIPRSSRWQVSNVSWPLHGPAAYLLCDLLLLLVNVLRVHCVVRSTVQSTCECTWSKDGV